MHEKDRKSFVGFLNTHIFDGLSSTNEINVVFSNRSTIKLPLPTLEQPNNQLRISRTVSASEN